MKSPSIWHNAHFSIRVIYMFSFTSPRIAAILCLLLIHSVAWADEVLSDAEYSPGKGWQVPGTGFKLGGYASVAAENDHQSLATIDVDNFSLFIHWEGEGKLRLFSELDLERPVAWEQGKGISAEHAYLALERLYLEYLYSEQANLRVGKFLTPIGRWNVVHAAPLVWTTSRPLITEHTFPTNTTGAMLYGTLPALDNSVDYSIYTAVGNDWRPDPKLDPFEEAYGAHVTLPVEGIGEIGFSYANFEQKSSIGERKNLLGMDYFWSHDRYEISAEAAYRFSDNGTKADEKGLFIQGVMPVSDRWYALARYELFDPAGSASTMNLWLAGLAMRLSPAMIVKAEYSHATNNSIHAPAGLFASFAILF